MFTRPDDLSDTDVVRAIADGWGLRATEMEWAPVGFGSHHWRVSSDHGHWFVTVDDLDARLREATDTRAAAFARLSAALTAARALRDFGLDFVIAPSPTEAGEIVHPLCARYVSALYGHVEGTTHLWGAYPTGADRLAVLDQIIAIHSVPAAHVSTARSEDFVIPRRDELKASIASPPDAWGPGPFAAPTRALLHQHHDALHHVFAHYDRLVDELTTRKDRWVLTHGEPHRGNTINTGDGVVLIDWDTALLAPPERDLWMLIDEDTRIGDVYSEHTRTQIDAVALQLYRLWWDLCEISLYAADFRRRHDDTDDTRVAWEKLQVCVDPARWSRRA